ncbi:hypothetical protein [Microbacterium sp.]|uniref:hypothetical protein n=1 Tax=Microbacterium sp. TaxID=51671 RepID=UPI003F9CB106
MGNTMTGRTASVRIAGGALAVVVAATLTGCFANPLDAIVDQVSEGVAQDSAEQLIEGVTGGETDISFGSLPDGFPAEVPLVSENVLQSVTVAEGTLVVVSDPRSMQELTAQVKSDFAGWEQIAWSDMGEMVTGLFKKDESLGVSIGIVEGSDGEDNTVAYTVITPQE